MKLFLHILCLISFVNLLPLKAQEQNPKKLKSCLRHKTLPANSNASTVSAEKKIKFSKTTTVQPFSESDTEIIFYSLDKWEQKLFITFSHMTLEEQTDFINNITTNNAIEHKTEFLSLVKKDQEDQQTESKKLKAKEKSWSLAHNRETLSIAESSDENSSPLTEEKKEKLKKVIEKNKDLISQIFEICGTIFGRQGFTGNLYEKTSESNNKLESISDDSDLAQPLYYNTIKLFLSASLWTKVCDHDDLKTMAQNLLNNFEIEREEYRTLLTIVSADGYLKRNDQRCSEILEQNSLLKPTIFRENNENFNIIQTVTAYELAKKYLKVDEETFDTQLARDMGRHDPQRSFPELREQVSQKLMQTKPSTLDEAYKIVNPPSLHSNPPSLHSNPPSLHSNPPSFFQRHKTACTVTGVAVSTCALAYAGYYLYRFFRS